MRGGGGREVGDDRPTMVITPMDHSDSRTGAEPVVSGQRITGSLDSSDDVDYFRLTPSGPSTISVTLDAPAGAEIALLDRAGKVLVTAITESEVTLEYTVGTEDHYIRIRNSNISEKIASAGNVVYSLAIGRFAPVVSIARSVWNYLRRIPDYTLDLPLGTVSVSLPRMDFPGWSFSVVSSGSLVEVAVTRESLEVSPHHNAVPGRVTLKITARSPSNELVVESFNVILRESNQPPRHNEFFRVEEEVEYGEPFSRRLLAYFEDEKPEDLVFTTRIIDMRGEWRVEIRGQELIVHAPANVTDGEYVLIRVTGTDQGGLSDDLDFFLTGPSDSSGTSDLFGAVAVVAPATPGCTSRTYGWSNNFGTREAATAKALEQCRNSAGAEASNCTLTLEWGTDRCGAYAEGESDCGIGFSPSHTIGLNEAERLAVSQCRGFSASNCVVRVSRCASSSGPMNASGGRAGTRGGGQSQPPGGENVRDCSLESALNPGRLFELNEQGDCVCVPTATDPCLVSE